MDLIRVTLNDCYLSYNDISCTQKDKQDVEVSFPRLIVCFRYTFRSDAVKIHIEFCGLAIPKEAHSLADCIAKMDMVIDSPHVAIDCLGNPKYIELLITKPTMYDIAKLCLLFTRYPVSGNHEENIL